MDIPGYSQKNTDRFGVLLDLWACELGYLEKKKKVYLLMATVIFTHFFKLVDCYLEAYHQTSNKSEKKLVAQVCNSSQLIKNERMNFICHSSSV